jgi:prolyl oligopeptidase
MESYKYFAGVLGSCVLGMGAVAAVAPPATAPPVAAVEPVVDEYFGTRVTDNYRWMEDRSAPRFVEWIKGQDAYAPNTYRDLIVCAEYLIGRGIGGAASLAIEGRSAGGITVGMALAERPDLFRVVFSGVGDSNTLRSEKGTDGPANSLEYGSTATRAGFDALYAVDSTQHLKAHTPYPAVLLTTGMNDPRVAPWQPGKMTAGLQAATSSDRPILLLADFGAGHGMGSTRSQRDREFADQLAFFYWQIGRPDYRVDKGAGG